MVKKASKRLYILRVLRRCGVPPADLRLIYFSLVRSTLEYACAVWHTSLPIYLSQKIEMVQKRGLFIIHLQLHYEDALLTLQCSRLDDRRSSLCLKTLKKIEESVFTICSLCHAGAPRSGSPQLEQVFTTEM